MCVFLVIISISIRCKTIKIVLKKAYNLNLPVNILYASDIYEIPCYMGIGNKIFETRTNKYGLPKIVITPFTILSPTKYLLNFVVYS